MIAVWERNLFAGTNVGECLDCCFEDEDSGELFFVELEKVEGEEIEEFIDRCFDVAMEDFDNVKFIEVYSVAEAEVMGFDTY